MLSIVVVELLSLELILPFSNKPSSCKFLAKNGWASRAKLI